MGAGHSHGHAAGRAQDRSRLRLVLVVTCSVIGVQLVGAWVSGSLALLADAGHMVTDAAAVALSLSASYVATRPPNARRTFGFHRAEILAALSNAVV
ncbi:MAG TPA: cation diffusion facilitator family transporter, partial [Nocardioidaceae bacterium]|nr:cation diffusion facilitator family transporter [Nocardioidaceae bacterium]